MKLSEGRVFTLGNLFQVKLEGNNTNAKFGVHVTDMELERNVTHPLLLSWGGGRRMREERRKKQRHLLFMPARCRLVYHRVIYIRPTRTRGTHLCANMAHHGASSLALCHSHLAQGSFLGIYFQRSKYGNICKRTNL